MQFQIVRSTDPRFPYFWRMVDDEGHMLTYSSARYRSCEECVEAVDELRGRLDATPVIDLTAEDREPV